MYQRRNAFIVLGYPLFLYILLLIRTENVPVIPFLLSKTDTNDPFYRTLPLTLIIHNIVLIEPIVRFFEKDY